VKTFEAQNPGSTLVIEEQQWTGLVDKLTTSLSSNDTPDIVEMGNTQSPAFTSSGALLDISDIKDTIGGDDLLPGFVEAGSWDGKLYAAPYYSGARIVFYNTAQYATAGVQVPTTLDEYVANGEKLAQALPGSRGLLPGQGLVQRAALHLGERRRDRRAEGRQVGGADVQRRLGQGHRAGAAADDHGLARPEGRRRDRSLGSVPHREGSHPVGAQLGVLVDRRR
jgi:hypothetical protein